MPDDETTHTPGPWTVGQPSPNGTINIGSDGVTVAQAMRYDDGDLNQANAHLITAAPDYHEAVTKERLPGFNAIDTLEEAADLIEDRDLQQGLREIASDLQDAVDKATN